MNIRKKVNVKFGFNVRSVALCDLLERKIADLEVKNNTVTLDLKGFEIVTLKVQ